MQSLRHADSMAGSMTVPMVPRSPDVSMSLDMSDQSPAATSPPNSLSCNPSPTPTPKVPAFPNRLRTDPAEAQAATKQQEIYLQAMRQTEGLSWQQLRAAIPAHPIAVQPGNAVEQYALLPAATHQELAAQALDLLGLVDTVLRGTGCMGEQAASVGQMLQVMHMRFAAWSASSFVPVRSLPALEATLPQSPSAAACADGLMKALDDKEVAQSPNVSASRTIASVLANGKEPEEIAITPSGIRRTDVRNEERPQQHEEGQNCRKQQQQHGRAPYFAARVQDDSDESDRSAHDAPTVLTTRHSGDHHTDSAHRTGPSEREASGPQLRGRLSVNSLKPADDSRVQRAHGVEPGTRATPPHRHARYDSPVQHPHSPRSRSRSYSAEPGESQQHRSKDRDIPRRTSRDRDATDMHMDRYGVEKKSHMRREAQQEHGKTVERQQQRDRGSDREQGRERRDRFAANNQRGGRERSGSRWVSPERDQDNGAGRRQDRAHEGGSAKGRTSPVDRLGYVKDRSQQGSQQYYGHDRAERGRDGMPARDVSGRQTTHVMSKDRSPIERRWRSISPDNQPEECQGHPRENGTRPAREAQRQSPSLRHSRDREQHQQQQKTPADQQHDSPAVTPARTPACSEPGPQPSPLAAPTAETEMDAEDHPCLYSSGAEDEEDAQPSDNEEQDSPGPPLYVPSPAAKATGIGANVKVSAVAVPADVEPPACGEREATTMTVVAEQQSGSLQPQAPRSPCACPLPAPSPTLPLCSPQAPCGPFAAAIQQQGQHDTSAEPVVALASLQTVDSAQLDAALGPDWSPCAFDHELHLQPQQHQDTDALMHRHLFPSDDGQLLFMDGLHDSGVQYADDDVHDAACSEQPQGEAIHAADDEQPQDDIEHGDNNGQHPDDIDHEDDVQQLLEASDEEMHEDDDQSQQHADEDTEDQQQQQQHVNDKGEGATRAKAGKEATTARYPDGGIIHFFSHGDMHTVMRRSRLPLLHFNKSSQQREGQQADEQGANNLDQQQSRQKLLDGTALLLFCNTERRLLHGMYFCRSKDDVERLQQGDWTLKAHDNSQASAVDKSPPSFDLVVQYYEDQRFSSLPLEEMEDIPDLEEVQRACLMACRTARAASTEQAPTDAAYPALLPSIHITAAQAAALRQLMKKLQAQKAARSQSAMMPSDKAPSSSELRQHHNQEQHHESQDRKRQRYAGQPQGNRSAGSGTYAHILRAQQQIGRAGSNQQTGPGSKPQGAWQRSNTASLQGRASSQQQPQRGPVRQGQGPGSSTGGRVGPDRGRDSNSTRAATHSRQQSPGQQPRGHSNRQGRLDSVGPHGPMQRQRDMDVSPPPTSTTDRHAVPSNGPRRYEAMQRESVQHEPMRREHLPQRPTQKVCEQGTRPQSRAAHPPHPAQGSRWVSPSRENCPKPVGGSAQQARQPWRSSMDRQGGTIESQPVHAREQAVARKRSQSRDRRTPEASREREPSPYSNHPAQRRSQERDRDVHLPSRPRSHEHGSDDGPRVGRDVHRAGSTAPTREHEPPARDQWESRSPKRARR